MEFSRLVLDHCRNPRNVGSLEKDDVNVGTGLVGRPESGDVIKLQIKVSPETGVIGEAKFKAVGCSTCIASASVVTEWLKGCTIDRAVAIAGADIAGELRLSGSKVHAALLAEQAIKAAVADYQNKLSRSHRHA